MPNILRTNDDFERMLNKFMEFSSRLLAAAAAAACFLPSKDKAIFLVSSTASKAFFLIITNEMYLKTDVMFVVHVHQMMFIFFSLLLFILEKQRASERSKEKNKA